MIDLNSVSIDKIDFGVQNYDEIYQNLRIIYTTPVGTVPFDRNFGIDFSILDYSLPITQGKLLIEYIEKTKKYEPRVKVKEVFFVPNEENGTLIPKVVIENADNIE
ncbi:phage baseplate assembly protein W [Sedimentibacter acidaminivorans]|uniref:Phage baseplate assembly protein W n=1 Tax=Sedimentibacter acidaminivorans TaxID=913099 RepID=A0ABS4GA76_9FIRM|nr:hypothetical protein [Sedimentibacter acidaminivorans]MBP1924586.1 phage baseplate assembly protein W [Sedimentibacter acidaminivorans]